MAKFKYRMQNILDIKCKLETQAKLAYGIAEQKYQEEQAKLQELFVKRAGYEKQLRELMDGNLNLHEIHVTKEAVDSLKVLVRRQMVEVHKAQKQLDEARNALNEIIKERKMHEKLREKAFDAFLKEQLAEENKAIDGLVSYTYNAK